jgi:putative ABC transport system permease protein
VGETFSLPAASGMTELTVVGILPADIMPGNEEVLVNLPQAQLMTAEPGKVNLIELNVEAFAGPGPPRRDPGEYRSRPGRKLPGRHPDGRRPNVRRPWNWARSALSLFGVLALFMGGFIIFNTFRTVVTERRRDIGMLRALGATRRTVIGMILAESLIQGLLGSVIGLLLGYLLAVGRHQRGAGADEHVRQRQAGRAGHLADAGGILSRSSWAWA